MQLEQFKKWVDYLSGKKTYIVGTLIVGVAALMLFGAVPKERVSDFLIILNGAGIVTIRAAITKNKDTTK